jgi:hypothetical protein
MSKPSNIQPVAKSKKVVMVLSGHPGVGKTSLIGGAPRTLIIRPPIDHTDVILGTETEEWVVQDHGELEDSLLYMKTEGKEEFDWVWLDSATLMDAHLLDDVWDDVIAKKPHRKEYGPDKGEYGVNRFRLHQWIRRMAGTPGFNFGVSAHLAEVEGLAKPDEILLGPLIPGKDRPQAMCAMANIVARLEINDKGKRVLRTTLTDEAFGKDQFGFSGENGRIVEPTMPEIIAAIESARRKKKGKKTSGKPARGKAAKRPARRKGRR